MTDLTPEQIEKWAADEACAKRWEKVIADALRYYAAMPGYYNEYLLHAHARMLQQQATIERLTNLIEEHNREMREMCGHDPMCIKCRAVGKKCPGCTRYYMIDITDGGK